MNLFAQDLRRSLTPPQHVGVASGHGVVLPLMGTVCGVGDVFSPPLYARQMRFQLEFDMDGRRTIDDGNCGKGDCGLLYAGGTWQVDRLIRHGTYHHRGDGKLFSLEVHSELFALRDRCGFALRVAVHNRCGRRIHLQVRPLLLKACPGTQPLALWDYGVQGAGSEVKPTGPGQWSNGTLELHLHTKDLARDIETGKSAVFCLALEVTPAGGPVATNPDVQSWIEQTIGAWQSRLQQTARVFPTLKSDIPGLEDYYNRSLVSGLVCIWDRADFVTNPYLTTCGMDGGGICCYPWDTSGYAAHAVGMLLGDKLAALARAMASFGLDEHSRYSPDGTGRDVVYANNAYAFINLVYTAALHLGIDHDLYTYAANLFLTLQSRLNIRDNLADYGYQHNLLEMRQAGYEHYVCSPNAERAWCYQHLADIGQFLGDNRVSAWRKEADAIIQAIRKHLWSKKAGFFKCLYPDGHEETVLSIQGFDAMRMGACNPDMMRAMLRHVRAGAFLGEYGVSSVSAEDTLHYELNDPDWSGGGAYTGDGPLLALTLWEQDQPALAWDVLQRHFWMGKHLLYYPQEHYCDRPAVPAHKRANVIAGLSGAEAIIFGLVGLRLELDGSLRVQPGWPKGLRGNLELSNVVFRGQRVTIRQQDGKTTIIPHSGTKKRSGKSASHKPKLLKKSGVASGRKK